MASTAVFLWLFLLLLVLLPSSTPLPFQIHSDDIKFLQDDQEQQSARNELDWQWQRTGFHFQPSRNWMNDPNGPLYYKGLYHLFYQYNPFAAVWGNITWGHAISKDLVRWHYVKDLALIPDRWYDIKGVWSGAATIVHGKPVLLYTGWSNSSSQIQNMAVPKNVSDPLLREWVKDDRVNPIAVAPPGINSSDFRDPTTAWIGHDGHWRMAVGSKHRSNNTGIILQYRSKDFARWELLDKLLHTGPGTGMWECPDFFPVLALGKNGAENYLQGGNGNDVSAKMKFVMKVSLDEKRWDTYVVGDYDPVLEEFKPSLSSNDIGNGDLRYDYGIYYASKTFFDPVKKRRILLGWISEADKPASDIRKGWASLQATPRHIWLDESKHTLRQWPISEINSLRKHSVTYGELLLKKGTVKELKAAQGSQLDIEVVFEIPTAHLHNRSTTTEYDFENDYNFETSGGVEGIPNNTLMYCNGTFPSAHQIIGPFGLHVLASSDLRERTAVFFKFLRFKDGWKTLVCNDLTSSSLASDSTKGVYGSTVDHSIVETFAQGGKTCITARSYPLLEGDDNIAHLFSITMSADC